MILALPPMPPGQIVFESGIEPGTQSKVVYRIPSLICTKNGTLIAFAEKRESVSDQAANQIVLKEKKPGQSSWSGERLVESAGKNALNNPCALVDHRGTIWLMYQEYPAGLYERTVKPGYDPKTSCRSFVVFSRNDGRSWSRPEDLTRIIREANAKSVASGPGIGIELEKGQYKGRLVFPFNEQVEGRYVNFAVFSDNDGKSWVRGANVPQPQGVNGNETQIAELSNGEIMMNSRNEGKNHHRFVSTSSDGGQTWSELSPDASLPDPVCTGLIVRLSFSPNIMAFANPASEVNRTNGTVRFSVDDGKTWPNSVQIVPGSYQYSCLCPISKGRLGILYEAVGPLESGGTGYQIRYLELVIRKFTETQESGSPGS